MAKNLLLGCVIGIIIYVNLFEDSILRIFRIFTDGLNDENGYLRGINVEKTCLQLRNKLGKLNDSGLGERNANYYWSLLSCSKILSYTTMEKVGHTFYCSPRHSFYESFFDSFTMLLAFIL